MLTAGQHVYFSVRRDDDNGSIGDFVQCRQICERGRVGPQRTTSQVGQAPVAVPAFPALCADKIARYASIGQTNPKQLDLILAEMIGHVLAHIWSLSCYVAFSLLLHQKKK